MSSLFGSTNDGWSCFLVRKPYNNDQNGVTTAALGSVQSAAPGLETALYHTARHLQHLTVDKITYAIAILSMALDPTNGN